MVQNIISDLCHHLEIGIDGNLDIGNKRVIVGTPTITLTNNILTISCDTAGASIYYTLDGSTPTFSSTKYTTAVTLNNSCIIKAIAIKGNKSSIVVSQNYIAILSAWKIVGNSEVHGNEIWSCGEYSAVDGKYHILVQPLGGSIADIALTEPLRMVNNVADTIEFPSETEGKALVTRPLKSIDAGYYAGGMILNNDQVHYRYSITISNKKGGSPIVLTTGYTTSKSPYVSQDKGISCGVAADNKSISFYNDNYCQSDSATAFRESLRGNELIYELETPTTELVDAPQIAEAESYTCVISQGAKVVSWSDFIPNPT